MSGFLRVVELAKDNRIPGNEVSELLAIEDSSIVLNAYVFNPTCN